MRMRPIQVVMVSRSDWIEELVQMSAKGELPFSYLCEQVAARGYKTTSLYEMVRACEQLSLPPPPAKEK